MEQLRKEEASETRLTQAELAALLDRWRDERENTVSVADVAEALHCSKAEIEALVWRSRAEGKTKVRQRISPSNVRSLMAGAFVIGVILLLVSSTLGFPERNEIQAYALLFLSAWSLYATIYVLADLFNNRD